jgi:glycosyltransferase involved in cell wall biosynthesis
MKKSVMIIELIVSGHHIVWLEKISRIFLKNNCKVIIAILEDYISNPLFGCLKKEFGKDFTLISYQNIQPVKWPIFSYILNDFRLRRKFGEVFLQAERKLGVDYVFLPYLDYCVYSLGLMGNPFNNTKFGGVLHQADIGCIQGVKFPPEQSKLSSIKRFLFVNLLKNKRLGVLLTQNEILNNFVLKNYPKISKKISYMPNPVDLMQCNYSKEFCRSELGISIDAIVILVYGAISDRKGLDLLIDALSSNNTLSTIEVLLVGRQQESIGSIIKSLKFNHLLKSNRMHIINKFVNNETQSQVFLASDIVWLGYKNFFTSSGVLSLAAKTDNLILGTRDGLIGWYVERNRLGEVFNVNDINSVISAIEKLSNHNSIKKYKRNADFDFFKNFTWSNSELLILESIK